uniref:Ig-like domain-containing protein n=1 Tax=Gadus morhua TaxID=8049 RepID=A0A8C5BDD6_GADMO
MWVILLSLSLIRLIFSTGVNCEQLTQPESLIVRPGQSLNIRCQVSYSVSSGYTQWIRQPDGNPLEWIGYIRTDGKKVKDSLSSKFSLAVDEASKTVTLQGQNMQPGDSAVYYCARETQLYKLLSRMNKNPTPVRCYYLNPPEGELSTKNIIQKR